MTPTSNSPAVHGDSVHAPQTGARKVARLLSGRGIGLFSEVVVVGLAVALLSIPAVTALPAFAAGAAHLRRHAAGESDALTELVRDFLRAWARGWGWGLTVAAGFSAIVITLTSPMTNTVPGGELFCWISGLIGVIAAVVLLRATGSWTSGSRWTALVRGAADDAWRDWSGSLLLALALGLCAVIVWMFAPLVVLAPGLLILATRAVVVRGSSSAPSS